MKHRIQYSLFFSLLIAIINIGCQDNNERKIKLASDNKGQRNISKTSSTVLQISPEEQKSIAILYFKNETNDQNLNWLQRGLADMLITELTQSPLINVISINLMTEMAQKLGKSSKDLHDISLAALAARELNAEVILTGRFYNREKSLHIDVEILDVNTVQIIRSETVSGENMERIFTMVDDLSKWVRNSLRDEVEDNQYARVNLSQMTKSLEAFKCYSLALENAEKFLFEEAEKCVEDAIKADSTFAVGYLYLANLKINMEKWDEAREAIAKTHQLIDKLSETDRIRLKLAEAKIKRQYHKIIPLLIEALNHSPSDINLRLQLARHYRGIGQIDHALQEFEIVQDLAPNNKSIFNDLGYIYAQRGDFNTALKYIDKYQELAPDEPNPYDSKGEILIWAGQLYEAVHELETALQKWPKFHFSASRLSFLYAELGDFNKAMYYTNYLIKHSDPPYGKNEISYIKGMINWKFDKIKAAEDHFKLALASDPLNIKLILTLGQMYKSIGDLATMEKVHQKAFRQFQQEFENKKEDLEFNRNLIRLVLQSSIKPEEAIPLLDKIAYIQKDPNIATEAKATAYVLYARNEQYDKAKPYYDTNYISLIDLIAENYNSDWGTLWKFISESISHAPKLNPFGNSFSNQLLQKAEEVDRNDLKYMAHLLRALAYSRSEQGEEMARIFNELGVPLEDQWYVIGPFHSQDFSGFLHEYAPEKNSDITALYQEDKQEYYWKPANDNIDDGYINLKSIFHPSSWAVAYAQIYIYSPDKRKVQIRLGNDEASKLWLNNKLIWKYFLRKGARIDREVLTVVLHPGTNKLLLKVTNTDLDWGFYFRVTDPEGNGIPDIKFYSPKEVNKSLASL